MGIRHWFRNQLLKDEAGDGDLPPNTALVQSLFGKDESLPHSLGEYSADSYPEELAEALRRRSEVAEALLALGITQRERRIAAIPELQRLLRRYPHPLAYEALIHAYMDEGRYDEAKGVAFAARERRMECERSPYPEIRAEIDRLQEWSPEEIDKLREEQQVKSSPTS